MTCDADVESPCNHQHPSQHRSEPRSRQQRLGVSARALERAPEAAKNMLHASDLGVKYCAQQVTLTGSTHMKLQRLLGIFILGLSLIATPAWAGGLTGTRSYAHSSSRAITQHSYTHTTSRSTGNRPYYGGVKHTVSHGGSYGVSSSSHKGGHYTSTTGSHLYGRHK